jgi:hypothetical protein
MSNEWDRMRVGRQQQPSETIKKAQVCTECGTVFWASLCDLMRLSEMPEMPCGHKWMYIELRKSLEVLDLPEPGGQA